MVIDNVRVGGAAAEPLTLGSSVEGLRYMPNSELARRVLRLVALRARVAAAEVHVAVWMRNMPTCPSPSNGMLPVTAGTGNPGRRDRRRRQARRNLASTSQSRISHFARNGPPPPIPGVLAAK